VKRIVDGYKDFAPMIMHTIEEPQDMRKHCTYRLSKNGLLYFEDMDHKVRLSQGAQHGDRCKPAKFTGQIWTGQSL